MDTIAANPLVVVVGETASGKSRIGMQLAERFGGEIIAADAWTVYEYFNIGTAKPSSQDRKRVNHHLVDVFKPTGHCNAAEYKQLAIQAVNEVSSRGKLPILVGGTGLYVDSVLFDYQFRSRADTDTRNVLNTMTNDQLLAEVIGLGLPTEDIDTANNRRLIRLIESRGVKAEKSPLRKNTLILGQALPREELKTRVTRRVEAMFASGLELEVNKLVKQYGWDVSPMQAIGYREFQAYFEESQTLDETKALIIRNTMHLAKKQRTWFKRNKSIHWVDSDKEAVALVTTFLNNYRR